MTPEFVCIRNAQRKGATLNICTPFGTPSFLYFIDVNPCDFYLVLFLSITRFKQSGLYWPYSIGVCFFFGKKNKCYPNVRLLIWAFYMYAPKSIRITTQKVHSLSCCWCVGISRPQGDGVSYSRRGRTQKKRAGEIGTGSLFVFQSPFSFRPVNQRARKIKKKNQFHVNFFF